MNFKGLFKVVLGGALALTSLDHLARELFFSTDRSQASYTVTWRVEGNGISHWSRQGVRENGNGRVQGPTVLVLGDSLVEALQVDDAEVFVAIAERELRQQGWLVNLVNAGKAERSLADYIARSSELRDLVSPQWTVVVMRDQDLTEDAWTPSKPHFCVAAEGGLRVSSPEPVRAPARPNHSGWLLSRLWPWATLRDMSIYRWSLLAQRWQQTPPIFRATQSLPPEEERVYPIEDELELLAESFSGRVTVLYVPFSFPTGPRCSDLQRRVEEICHQKGIHYLDASLEWEELLHSGHPPQGFPNTSYNQGHLNRWGHAALAETLIRALQALRSTELARI